MAWVNPSTRATGATITAAIWNQDVVANAEFLARPPSASVSRSTEQSIANAAWRAISFNTEAWDTDSMWSSTAGARIDINTSGKYHVIAHAAFAASAAGAARALGISVGGSTTAPPTHGHANATPNTATLGITHSRMLSLTSTQFIRIMVYQDSGGALNIVHSTETQPACDIRWVSS